MKGLATYFRFHQLNVCHLKNSVFPPILVSYSLQLTLSWLLIEAKYIILVFTDNGPHHHNTAVLLYLEEVNRAFNVKLMEYNKFEAGEGKTVLDTHFAHVSHKIVRWVHVGNDLDTGEQLGNLLEVI